MSPPGPVRRASMEYRRSGNRIVLVVGVVFVASKGVAMDDVALDGTLEPAVGVVTDAAVVRTDVSSLFPPEHE